jgi:hypothetical protein
MRTVPGGASGFVASNAPLSRASADSLGLMREGHEVQGLGALFDETAPQVHQERWN